MTAAPEPKPAEPRSLTERLRAVIAKLLRSEVQPTVISDRSGERFLGIRWKRDL